MNLFRYLIVAGLLVIFISCKQENKKADFFHLLESDLTGLTFNNKLTSLPDLNMLSYMYFYNGAGVGAGDFNNDGLTDLFFAGNQVRSRLYLNSGNMKFRDVTEVAEYLMIKDGQPEYRLLISTKTVSWTSMFAGWVNLHPFKIITCCWSAKVWIKMVFLFMRTNPVDYGLDFSGFSTQAAFLDYDLDGDLDMYLLNHSLRYNSTFQPRDNYSQQF